MRCICAQTRPCLHEQMEAAEIWQREMDPELAPHEYGTFDDE